MTDGLAGITTPLSDPEDAGARLDSVPLRADGVAESDRNAIDAPLPMRLPNSIVHARIKQLSGNGPQPKATSRANPEPADSAQAILAKRRRRRYENASLRSNPYATPPAHRDLLPGRAAEDIFPTFPAPPPRGFASAVSAPDTGHSYPNETTRRTPMEESGRFNRSLKGVRRAIKPMVRGECGRAYQVIKSMENELAEWLDASHVWQMGDLPTGPRVIFEPAVEEGDASPVDSPDLRVVIVSTSPANMVLRVADALNRYLIHCTARFWGLVSFTKTNTDGGRLTWLLRSYTPLRAAQATLHTPPTTEFSSVAGSELDTESEDGTFSEDGWTDVGAASPLPQALLERVESRSSAEGDIESAHEDSSPSLTSSFASLDLTPLARRGRSRGPDSRSTSPSPSRRRPRRGRRPQVRSANGLRRKAWSPPRIRFLDYLLM